VVADLNGDAAPDVAVACAFYDQVAVAFGDGAGGLGGFAAYDTGDEPLALAVGDLNGDSNPDLVAVNNNDETVTVLLNDGSGVFASAGDYATGRWPDGLAVADFNEDGALDVVTADRSSVSLLLGGGDGTLGAPDTFSYWTDPIFYVNSVTAADVDADGHVDMVVGISGGAGGFVSIRPGRGDGTFAEASRYPAGEAPLSPRVADFNGDGTLDVAVINQTTGTVTVVEGRDTGLGARRVETGRGPRWLFVGDLDADGHLDLATADDVPSSDDDTLSVHLGHGDGTFAPLPESAAPVRPRTLMGGDVDGDGLADLLVGTATDEVWLLRNLGGGAFGSPSQVASLFGSKPFCVADVDLDGALDLIGPAGLRLIVEFGNGDGTFHGEMECFVGNGPRDVWVGDFNGDGWPDLASANAQDDSVSIVLNAGDETFLGSHHYPAGHAPAALFGWDFNEDGSLDLAVVNTDGSVSILLNRGDGSLAAPTAYDVGFVADPEPNAIAGADLDQDGALDLVVSNDRGGAISVLLSVGDGTFEASRQFAAAGTSAAIAVGDFNEDGQPDLAFCDYSDDAVDVLVQGRPMPWRSEILAPRRSGHIVAGDALRFAAEGWVAEGPRSYAWDFGDGRTSSLQDPGLVAFPAVGTYEVAFAIVDSSGTPDPSPATRTVTVVADRRRRGAHWRRLDRCPLPLRRSGSRPGRHSPRHPRRGRGPGGGRDLLPLARLHGSCLRRGRSLSHPTQ